MLRVYSYPFSTVAGAIKLFEVRLRCSDSTRVYIVDGEKLVLGGGGTIIEIVLDWRSGRIVREARVNGATVASNTSVKDALNRIMDTVRCGGGARNR